MIGVLCRKEEENVVREFFELFKTPWELCKENHEYDVIISTRGTIPKMSSKLLIMYNSEECPYWLKEGVGKDIVRNVRVIDRSGIDIPIYGEALVLKGEFESLLCLPGDSGSVGIVINRPEANVLFVGFDLFHEVSNLLREGQPPENATIPTLDIHIALLRSWILHAGLPLVEIPPVPAGYRFSVTLTHDVDFIKISQHKYDLTFFGFIYRALVVSLWDCLTRKSGFQKVAKNYTAVFSLPFVYLGLIQDFWYQFLKYLEIEKDVKSTFFVIPFKNQPGQEAVSKNWHRRATRYDVEEIQDVIQRLLDNGNEIGLHAIDAWHDQDKSMQEAKRITELTGQNKIGTRIHWLCNEQKTFQILDEAGYFYDSTFGYNNAIGYRAGTAQVFRPLDAKTLLELPLNIQDTALFYRSRMGLSERNAWELCQQLMETTMLYGGVLTILWHLRSLGPERCWDRFYIKLLSKVQEHKVWFATGKTMVEWFAMRRSVKFLDTTYSGKSLTMKIGKIEGSDLPSLVVRVYPPQTSQGATFSNNKFDFFDVRLDGKKELCFTF